LSWGERRRDTVELNEQLFGVRYNEKGFRVGALVAGVILIARGFALLFGLLK
jgi:hypothetical protein